MSNRASTRPRPRRIDDALSQLIDSLSPPLTLDDEEGGDTSASDREDILAAAEEQRHHASLQHAWRVFDTHATPTAGELSLPIGPAGYGIGSLVDGNINNASDLIKRRLLRGNAGPDRALRFSNLYSRLLTQPVLSQKWGILYLLYRLSGIG
ncbi:Microtubule-nucleating Tub4p (gamma-tubulin) complex component, partial [Elasticomyces elasticus]